MGKMRSVEEGNSKVKEVTETDKLKNNRKIKGGSPILCYSP